jgi:hypothetical protein
MEPPPTRYKIVERGRRLEVIDTWTGQTDAASRERLRPTDQAGIDDGTVFTTRAWHDDKAPRTVRMNYAAKARLTNLRYGIAVAVAVLVGLSFLFWPIAVILIVLLVSAPKLRLQLRAASTRWIDGFDQAA